MEYKFIEIKNNEDLKIRGVLNYNEKLDNNKTILILHGFTGNKLGNSFFYVRMSKEFVKKGYKVFRFDFTGSGESDGDFSQMTLSSEISDLDCIWNYINNLDIVRNNEIYIIGHSMGGLIATLTAHNYNPDKIVLLAPANNMKDLLNDWISQEKGESKSHTFKHQGFLLKRSFINDFNKCYPLHEAKKYKNPVLIMIGDKDPIITLDICEKTKEAFGTNCQLKVIEGADHSFVDFDIRTSMIEDILKFFG
ncbi:MAG: alpha/beta fold hydrolase [Lagierella massiliensis]|nr:alpha/beta fold hydrolase [Lagierella massiliensis]